MGSILGRNNSYWGGIDLEEDVASVSNIISYGPLQGLFLIFHGSHYQIPRGTAAKAETEMLLYCHTTSWSKPYIAKEGSQCTPGWIELFVPLGISIWSRRSLLPSCVLIGHRSKMERMRKKSQSRLAKHLRAKKEGSFNALQMNS